MNRECEAPVVIPEPVFRLYVPQWCLGDVHVTSTASDTLTSAGSSVEEVTTRLLRHDYGAINDEPHDLAIIQRARREGRPFLGLYQFGQDAVIVEALPRDGRTTVCLSWER